MEGPGRTRVLIDCGVRLRRLETALAGLGIDPHTISAVLITHEHIDHTYCLGLRNPFPARYGIPVYVENGGGYDHPPHSAKYGGDFPTACSYQRITLAPGDDFSVGEFSITAFRSPHDVPTLGFICAVDGLALGLATDLGHVSDEVARRLAGCTHLILESNHDRAMQLASRRPPSLIARVLGNKGHLSNTQAAAALPGLVSSKTRTVLLAHLSIDCNRPEIARAEADASLKTARWLGRLAVAPAAAPTGWLGA